MANSPLTILIDADAFIGFSYQEDAHYQKSLKLLKYAVEKNAQFSTCWSVVVETATKLSYFLAKKEAKKFLTSLKKNNIKIIYPNEEIAKKSIHIFNSFKSKRVSLTDCTNIAIYKKYNLDCIFSYDKTYHHAGVKLLEDLVGRS